jgi:hypothetical protein
MEVAKKFMTGIVLGNLKLFPKYEKIINIPRLQM